MPRLEYKLLDHQIAGVNFMTAHNYCILGDGMG